MSLACRGSCALGCPHHLHPQDKKSCPIRRYWGHGFWVASSHDRAALQRAFQADNTGAAAIRSAVAIGAMSESLAAAARNALTEAFDAGKAAAAGDPAARETGTQAAEAHAALLKAGSSLAAPDAGGVQAAAARAALQEAFARSSSLRSSSEDQQVQ